MAVLPTNGALPAPAVPGCGYEMSGAVTTLLVSGAHWAGKEFWYSG